MTSCASRGSIVRYLASVALLGCAYFAAGKLGLLLAIPPGFASAFWPPAGIALASVLLFGNRLWPGITLGSLALTVSTASAVAPASLLAPFVIGIMIGLGAALQALAGTFLVRRFVALPNALADEWDVLKLLAFVGPASCLINATVAVTVLCLAGMLEWTQYPFTWCNWWAGDTLGAILLVPLAIVWQGSLARERRPLWISLPLIGLLGLMFAYSHLTQEQDIPADDQPWQAWLVLVAGLLIVASIEAFFLIVTGRAARIETLVAKRTRELADANEHLLRARDELEDRVRARTEALRISEERWRMMVESSPECIKLIAPDGCLIDINPAGLAMIGAIGKEPLLGRQVSDLVAPEDRERYRSFLGHICGGGQGSLEFDMYTMQGARRRMEIFAVPLRNPGDGVRMCLGITRDVTERRQAEERVRRSETRFRRLLEYAADAVFVLDAERRFVDVNQRACESLGYTRDELIGMYVSSIEIDLSGDVLRELRKQVDAGQTVTVEGRHRRKDGTSFPVEVRAGLVEAGDETLVLALVRDVSERVRAEQALRRSEERYRLLIENSLQGVAIIVDSRIQFASPRFADMFGYDDPAELIGRHREELTMAEYLPQLLQRTAACLQGESQPSFVQWEGVRKDGSTIWVESGATRIEWDGALAVLSFVLDVTQRKRLEEQLRQAQKLEAIGRLAGGVAHDFNNLLTVINSYSELLLDQSAVGSWDHEPIQEIRRAGERAASLTRQLLAFGRKQMLHPVPLDLNAHVADLGRMLKRLIGADIDFSVTLDPTLGRVLADPGQIEQVLVNLVVNARDAMPAGGKLIIQTRNVERMPESNENGDGNGGAVLLPRDYALLAVKDTGCGMDEATRMRVFEPFFTTKEVGKGTGLGLATVYGIVSQSGGYIEVESEPDAGTTFRVFLPRMADPVVVVPRIDDRLVSGGRETILLVEDEDAVRNLARTILLGLGYTVLTARNGREAIDVVSRYGPPALLVSDIIMPELNGRELADHLRTLHPDLPVLYCSGYSEDRGLVNCAAGSGFLPKPFTVAALARAVRELLDAQTAARLT